MYGIRKIFLLLPAFFMYSISSAQVADTLVHLVDTLVEVEEDCTNSFFERGERVESLTRTMLITKAKKTVSMASFLKTDELNTTSGHALADLDGDGRMELVIYGFTGGAHCCDEIYIFRNIGPDKYQYVNKLFAGNTCITLSNEFLYDFYEQFGYFFTCYACGFLDTTDTGPDPVHQIALKYSKGKMIVVRGNDELKSKLNDNLAKLGEEPYQALNNEIDQDNGLRKEFAMNLAVYHYSFGRNLVETQKLFNKYYKFPDAKKVWAEFVKHLQYIRKESDF